MDVTEPLIFTPSITMKEFIVTKSSVMEIQNFLVNPKSLLSQILNNTNFYLSTFPAKVNDKIFNVNNKNPFLVIILAQREFFLKTLAKYTCSGPQAFKCQRYRVEQNIIPSLLACKNHSINLLNSSNHFWDIPGLRLPRSLRSHPFLTTPTQ